MYKSSKTSEVPHVQLNGYQYGNMVLNTLSALGDYREYVESCKVTDIFELDQEGIDRVALFYSRYWHLLNYVAEKMVKDGRFGWWAKNLPYFFGPSLDTIARALRNDMTPTEAVRTTLDQKNVTGPLTNVELQNLQNWVKETGRDLVKLYNHSVQEHLDDIAEWAEYFGFLHENVEQIEDKKAATFTMTLAEYEKHFTPIDKNWFKG
jgi:hypothetical protein